MTTIELPVLVVRTTRVMYWLLGGSFGAVFLFSATVILREPAFWIPTTALGVVLAITLSWLATTSLTLASDALHYRALFVRVDLMLSEIIQAKFVTGFSGYKPYQRVVLRVRAESGEKDLIVNAGLFDPRQVRRLIESLNSRL